MVMVGVLFQMMMVMMREMRENELQADFDDDNWDGDADIRFDIDVPN